MSDVFAAPLKFVFHKTLSLKEWKIPQSWKSAEVKSIFKKGDKNDTGHYRPVSLSALTSVVCKTFEGFIHDALTKQAHKD